MRIKGNASGSKDVLETAMQEFRNIAQPSQQLHAAFGLLKISEALNSVQDEDLNAAISQLASWNPLATNSPSTMERVVFVNAQIQLAKVLRYQGKFDEALNRLNNVRREMAINLRLFEKDRSDIANELASVLTEKNEPVEARAILEEEMHNQGLRGRTNTAAFKLLQLSQAETFMRQGRFKDANECYSKLSSLGPFANLCLKVGLARIAHSDRNWEVAFSHWTKALEILAKHFPRGDSHSGYTSLGILRSSQIALSNSGQHEMSCKTQEQIIVITATCAPEGCKHWVPGLNSYWMDSIYAPKSRQTASL